MTSSQITSSVASSSQGEEGWTAARIDPGSTSSNSTVLCIILQQLEHIQECIKELALVSEQRFNELNGRICQLDAKLASQALWQLSPPAQMESPAASPSSSSSETSTSRRSSTSVLPTSWPRVQWGSLPQLPSLAQARPTPSDAATVSIARAKELIAKRDYDAAIELLKGALAELDPKQKEHKPALFKLYEHLSQIHFLKGTADPSKINLVEAQTTIEEALKFGKSDALWIRLSLCYYLTERANRGEECRKNISYSLSIVSLKHKTTEFLLLESIRALKCRNIHYKEAFSLLMNVLGRDPTHPLAVHYLGAIFQADLNEPDREYMWDSFHHFKTQMEIGGRECPAEVQKLFNLISANKYAAPLWLISSSS